VRRAAFLFLLAALAAGCREEGAPIPAVDALLSVTAGAEEVEVGAAFPLTVVRVWRKDLVPDAWNDRALAPLTLALEGTSRREDAERVEETRRYRAFAFRLSDVAVRAPRMVVRAGNDAPPRVVSAAPLHVRVRGALDPEDPGPPEVPGDLLLPPRSRAAWIAAAAGVLLAALAAAVLVRRARARRRGRVPVPDAPPPPAARPLDAAERTLARLVAIGGGDDPRSVREALERIAAVLRDDVAARLAVPAHERTSEEIVAALASAGSPARDALRRALARCDRAKFSGDASSPEDRDAAAADAIAFVRGTRDRA
jgi:hypothetical protein